MEKLFSNDTIYSIGSHHTCWGGPPYLAILSLIDVIPLLTGQPVIAKLLWITFTSKKATDILNFNLALFHNSQYLLSVLHLFFLFLMPSVQIEILQLLLVYAQVGGPMSLTFICMERYVAVIHPTCYPLLKTYRLREVCSAVVWLFTVFTTLAKVLAMRALSPFGDEGITLFPVSILVIMTGMVVRTSVSIARALMKSGPGTDKLHPAKRRAFKTVCATSCIVLFCYAPVTLLQHIGIARNYSYDCMITPVCIFLLSVASVVHPLFYLSAQGKLFPCSKSVKKAK